MMIQLNRSISTAKGAKPGGSWKRRLLAILVMLSLLAGCGKGPKADATVELAASFKDSPAKEDVIKAKAAYEQRRYKDSLKLLHAVVGRGDLTERQKKAIAGLVGQLLQAIHEDPQLSKDSQLHRMMELLVRRTMGET
jgi:hypothetical protein